MVDNRGGTDTEDFRGGMEDFCGGLEQSPHMLGPSDVRRTSEPRLTGTTSTAAKAELTPDPNAEADTHPAADRTTAAHEQAPQQKHTCPTNNCTCARTNTSQFLPAGY